MSTQTILDRMVLFVLNVTLWQGRKALQLGDLAVNGIDVSRFPPGTLATLGSKRIISPDALKIFVALKREAVKYCLQSGVRFGGGGYAVPREKAEQLSQELQRIKGEFEKAKAGFLEVYDEEVEKWIAANPPEWSPIIRAAVDSPGQIGKTLTFNFTALDVKAPDELDDNGLDEEVDSLYGQLCHEIRVAARHAFDSSFIGKQEVTRKALRPIMTMRGKLEGLLFLDPVIAETIQVIDDTLDRLPANGVIKGTDLNMVAGLVGRQLANMGRKAPEQREQEAEVDGDGAEDVIPPEIVNPQTGRVAPISWDF